MPGHGGGLEIPGPETATPPGEGAVTTGDLLKDATNLQLQAAFLDAQAAMAQLLANARTDPASLTNEVALNIETLITAMDKLGFEGAARGIDLVTLEPLTDLDAELKRENLDQIKTSFTNLLDRQKITDAQFQQSLAQQREIEEARLKESVRETNVGAALDLLESSVRRGDLDRKIASDRAGAAFDAAEVQRRVLQDQGQFNLPAGTEFFPGFEPNGAVANTARSFGIEFGGLATGGTFGVNPSAISDPIVAASQQGTQNIQADADAARQRSIAMLTGFGVAGG